MTLPFVPRSLSKSGKAATKGKGSEDTVKALLNELALQSGFDFERNYDARSSGGHNFQRRCGDFTWYMQVEDCRVHGVIEVKEIASRGAFPYERLDQIGKMKRRVLAGGLADVLIHVAPDTPEDCWVWEGIEWFSDNKSDARKSWDLRLLRTYPSLEDIPFIQMLRRMTPGTLLRR